MMDDPKRLYECLLDYCSSTDTVSRVCLGLVWTICQSKPYQSLHSGLSMTPTLPTRTLQWPGTLTGKPLKDIGQWLLQWEPYQASVGMAAVNCSINARSKPQGEVLDVRAGAPNLTVFEHFQPLLIDKKVVVIQASRTMSTDMVGRCWSARRRPATFPIRPANTCCLKRIGCFCQPARSLTKPFHA